MQAPISILSILFGLVLACITYFYGLDSRFAPKNGDEYPYTHIVRMTNAADAWLPLQSEMVGIKNTKPPLLFWQGMLSTDHGKAWSLVNLRWPSLAYTALTAILIMRKVHGGRDVDRRRRELSYRRSQIDSKRKSA